MTAFSRHDDPAHDKKSKTGASSGLARVKNSRNTQKTDPASSRA
ncbi:hypothetical protein [Paenibacillus thiaminolyticus]|nr:hypothetical protein [Paenibacillus thiaminolyticus]